MEYRMDEKTFEHEESGLTIQTWWEYDGDADLSYLGTFVNEAGEYVFDRKHGILLGKYLGYQNLEFPLSEIDVTDGEDGMTQAEWGKAEARAFNIVKERKHWLLGGIDDIELEVDEDDPTRMIGMYPGYEIAASDGGRYWHGDWRTYRYFKPEYPIKDADDAAIALQDCLRMEAYNNDHWFMRGCIATVTYGREELGRCSVWGVESDCGDEHEQETEQEMVSEALALALQGIAEMEKVLNAVKQINWEKVEEDYEASTSE